MSPFERDPELAEGAFGDPAQAEASVLDALTEAIVVFDPDGVVRMANPPARDLFGAPPEGLVGLNLLDSRFPVHDENGNPVSPDDFPVNVAFRTGERVVDAPVGTQRADGSPLWISVNAAPLFHDGDPVPYAVVASMTDITRYKEAELELARSNSDLSRFAAVVAHDLNAPLTVIAGMSDLVLKRSGADVDERSRLLLTRIGAAARSGQNLIRELLEFAKTGQGKIRTERVDLDEVTAQVIDVLEGVEGAHRVRAAALPTVAGDATQLGQVVQNLLSNALKFSDGPIAVSAEPGAAGWKIAVRDEGIGIAPDQIEEIFGMLARTPDAEGYPGTGIGLAVCRRIVERHGGRIWVESEPGVGSTFFFTVPAYDAPDAPGPPTPAAGPA